MLLKIGEETYPLVSVHDLSLSAVILLQRELSTVETISSLRTWADILAVSTELAGLSPEEAEVHPESLFILGVTVWACRVSSGERLSLLDACDIPTHSIEWVAEPGDLLTDRLPKGGGVGGKAKPGSASRQPGPKRTGPARKGKGKKRRK